MIKKIECSIVYSFFSAQFIMSSLLTLCSRKYAAHCSVIASRFALPPFSHPAPIPIKREGGYERLRVGYVIITSPELKIMFSPFLCCSIGTNSFPCYMAEFFGL